MEFRAWMLEAAFSYIRASQVLWQNNLVTPSMMNVAVGLEILFKSFQAWIDGPRGGIGEKYQAAKGHNLLQLFDAIPGEIREGFGWHTKRIYFENKTAELFVLARYPYEKNALSGGCTAIIGIAEEMIQQVIQAYKDGGCDDPWVEMYPNV
jgi:hypothetical protein